MIIKIVISAISTIILVRILISIKNANKQRRDPFYIFLDALTYIKTGKVPDWPKPKGSGWGSHNSSTWLTCPYCRNWKGSLSCFEKECGGCHTPTIYYFNSHAGTTMDIINKGAIKLVTKS